MDHLVQRRDVAFDDSLHLRHLAREHYGHAMVCDGATDNDTIARSNGVGMEILFSGRSDACRRDIDSIAMPASDDLGVAGYDADAGFGGCRGNRVQNFLKDAAIQPFSEDEAERDAQRPRAAYGQVVDRAADTKPTDIAAGEFQRLHNVAVDCQCEPSGSGQKRPNQANRSARYCLNAEGCRK